MTEQRTKLRAELEDAKTAPRDSIYARQQPASSTWRESTSVGEERPALSKLNILM